MKITKITGIAAAFLLASALFAAPVISAGSCGDKLTKNCTKCHSLNRICQKVGKKSKSRWKRTIKRMIKRGTKISKDDRNALLTCLVKEDKSIVDLCK